MDLKPLRVEDQLALQAQNEALQRELAELKGPPAPRRQRWRLDPARGWSIAIGVATILGMVALFPMIADYVRREAAAERANRLPRPCYITGHASGETLPWDPTYVFECTERRGRCSAAQYSAPDNSLHKIDVKFRTAEEADAFVDRYHLHRCTAEERP